MSWRPWRRSAADLRGRRPGLAVVLAAIVVACGGAVPQVPAASSTVGPRSMALAFIGGLEFVLTEADARGSAGGEGAPVCAGRIGSDPDGVSYMLPTRLDTDRIYLTFLVHRTKDAGTFGVGEYPDASVAAPAAVNVLLMRSGGPGEGFATWNSGAGTLVIDPGGRSGSLTATLPFVNWRKLPAAASSPAPTAPLGPLRLSGTWVCPDRG